MKIGIYAPCKNELKHCEAWYESCKNADTVVVADTGSTDGSKEKLQSLGVKVTDVRIIPWRFDDAFNIAMSLLPEDIDICIRLDMDERLTEGWRENLESVWIPGKTTRARYPYVWNWVSEGVPGRTWMGDRIHARADYRWVCATHEGLISRSGKEELVWTESFQIHQFPDIKKKDGDLSLLLEAVKDSPTDSRIRAYLGREYTYRKDYENATRVYKEFLTMPSNNIERGQAMINLSVTDPDNKIYWLKTAALEVPTHREPFTNLAQHYYNIQNWQESLNYAKKALEITVHPMDYTATEEAWGSLPYDLAAIALWNLKLYKEALWYAEKAVEHKPNDERLKNNLKLIQDKVKELN